MNAHALAKTLVVFVCFTILLASCISYNPIEMGMAKQRLAQGEWWVAFLALEGQLSSSDRSLRDSATTLIAQYPQFVPGLIKELRVDMKGIETPRAAIALKRRIKRVSKTGLADVSQMNILLAELSQTIVEGNHSGRLAFTLADEVSEFPPLLDEGAIAIIFERSVRSLESMAGRPQQKLIESTFTYAKAKRQGSDEFKRLEQSLPKIAFTKSQLETIVKDLYPPFVDQALKSAGLTVYFRTEPSRRLLEEDISATLSQRSSFLSILRSEPQPGSISVLLRELQFEERQLPERTQTRVVDYYQTNTLVAVLTMPRGASMLYEYSEGGAEINWAFELMASKDGQVFHERLLRDSVRRNYHFCSNLRVQNVFGGVQGASVYPNRDVQTICESGQKPVDIAELRGEVMRRLVDEIALIPPIAAVIARSR